MMLHKRREFLGSVATLVGGAALAHAISAAALPVLSRLYTPADFSVLASFSGLLSVISVAASLRYDVAVPMPERDDDALNLLALAVLLAIVTSLAVAVLALSGRTWLAELLKQPVLERFLPLLPVGVALASSYSALQHWFVRKGQFRVIAHSRITQTFLSTGVQAGLGWLALGPIGLLLGHIVNAGAACLWLGAKLLGETSRDGVRTQVSWARMKSVSADYSRFPRYSTIEALCNSASIHVPVIMIAALAAAPEAGYLMLAMTLMQAPMSLIGSAIGQVYLSRAPVEHRANRLGEFTVETVGDLLRVGVGPLIAAGIVSPVAFELVFGAGWQRAGVLVSWMTPWFVMQFLAVPVSMGLHVTGRQKHALALQAFGLAVRVIAVLGATWWASRFIGEAYAISGFLFYLVYLALVLAQVSAPAKDVARAVALGIPYILSWAVVGLALAALIQRLPDLTP
jgi:O-antigen/teichoic acid export membrane protein